MRPPPRAQVCSRSRSAWLAAALALAACSTSTDRDETAPAATPSPTDATPAETEPEEPVVRACYLDEAAARAAKAPRYVPPTGKYLGKCSKKTIEDLLACTHKSDEEAPDDPHCQALVPEKACLACIFDDRGAILEVKFPNVAGCIALATGDTTTKGCAAAYNTWFTCQKAGCASCFADDAVPREDQQACTLDAASGVCAERSPIDACGDLSQNEEYKQFCEQPETLDDRYLGRLYNYFCGTPGAF